MITQESILQIIQNIINFAMIVGIAVAVLSAIVALVISFFAGERTKETWYGYCKKAFVVGVLIVLIPGLFKLVLDWVGQGDKYQLPSGSITLPLRSIASDILMMK
ncbi:hypothetical protein [Lactococcus garvieae]